MAPPVGFEPTTKWLTVIYSTAELWRNIFILSRKDFIIIFTKVKLFITLFLKIAIKLKKSKIIYIILLFFNDFCIKKLYI